MVRLWHQSEEPFSVLVSTFIFLCVVPFWSIQNKYMFYSQLYKSTKAVFTVLDLFFSMEQYKDGYHMWPKSSINKDLKKKTIQSSCLFLV